VFLRDVYYLVKPAVPRPVRAALRSSLATRVRRRAAGSWPICAEAGRTPASWPGWPGGKRFAFVLTHDVEGSRGLDRCRSLATLEMDFGFRSSFNFVPEGEYETPQSLRSFLNDRGFEVGVHDLHHDGKLYRSRKTFDRHATRINHYLKMWDAVGFRSGFMLHELDWLHQLNVSYDASTFDTDPFEPQPDGMNTIFPFWVSRGVSGYVELPYTLPQDSTLFLVLREQAIDVWIRKLDWIAERGGMALVNVHPDYVSFNRTPGRSEYNVEFYEGLLTYVRTRYANDAWFALPRDIARHVRTHRAHSTSAERCIP
jgi:hypothetical protein